MTGDPVHIERGKLEWNLNTIVAAIGIGATLLSVAGVYFNSQRDILEIKDWQRSHEQLHRDRMADVQLTQGRNEERFRALENSDGTITRKQDTMEYRLTVLEQLTASMNKANQDLTSSVNDVKGDIKVIREILQRQDKQRTAFQ